MTNDPSIEDDWLSPIADRSEIVPGLWMGSIPSDGLARFAAVIDCCGVKSYHIPYNVIGVTAYFSDCDILPPREWLERVADTVNILRTTGDVLVHCQAGLNRSGLIVALALVRSGMPARAAIETIRLKRHADCLCNESFVAWLHGYRLAPYHK